MNSKYPAINTEERICKICKLPFITKKDSRSQVCFNCRVKRRKKASAKQRKIHESKENQEVATII